MMHIPFHGRLFILVGPSGSGKNAIMERILHSATFPHLRQLPTMTTRKRRNSEVEGIHHFFVETDEFERLCAENALVEYQEVHPGIFYGTPRFHLDEALRLGEHLIADIDINGAQALKNTYPQQTTLIFITPLDRNILEQRIRERRTDSEEKILQRLQTADNEMRRALETDYIVVNDNLNEAVKWVSRIIAAKLEGRKPEDGLALYANVWVTPPDTHYCILTQSDTIPSLSISQLPPDSFLQAAQHHLQNQFHLDTEPIGDSYPAIWLHEAEDHAQALGEVVISLRALNFPMELEGQWQAPHMLDLPFHLRASLIPQDLATVG